MPLSNLRHRWPILRIIQLALAVADMGVLAEALKMAQGVMYGDGWDKFVVGLCMLGPALTILWCIISLPLTTFRGSYHPGWDVGFDVFGFAAGTAVAIHLLVFIAENRTLIKSYYYESDSAEVKYSQLVYAGVVLTLLIALEHLAFLIRACRATHAHNASKKKANSMERDHVHA